MIRAPEPKSDSTGVIFDIKRYAIHDGPGIRTTVFFKGCPLRCGWCHNPESWKAEPEHGLRVARCVGCGGCVAACPHNAVAMSGGRPTTDSSRCVFCAACTRVCTAGAREIIGCSVTIEDLVSELEQDVPFYDTSGGGVTFSGGEPLMQADFLYRMLLECRTREIHTAVDTSCYVELETLERVSEQTELFLCDIKHMDAIAHQRCTGVGNDIILANVRRLASVGKPIIIRVPIVPGFNDSEDNIEATGRFAAAIGSVQKIDILPYNGGGPEKAARLTDKRDVMRARTPSDEHVHAIATRLQRTGIPVGIGG